MHHDRFSLLELDLHAAMAAECWCGEPIDAASRTPFGVAFCTECRARVFRSCASVLAIVKSPALDPRRRASRR